MKPQSDILLVLPELPASNTGGGVFLRELIEFLSGIAAVHLVLPRFRHQDGVYAAVQQSLGHCVKSWTVLEPKQNSIFTKVHRLFSLNPPQIYNFATKENRERLRVVRESLQTCAELAISPYAQAAYPGQRLSSNTKIVLVNVEEAIITIPPTVFKGKLFALWERYRVARASARAINSACLVGVVSLRDGAYYAKKFPERQFPWLPPIMKPRPRDRSAIVPGKVLITTNYTYWPNRVSLRWFLSEVWPLVTPRAHLTITGRDCNGKLAIECQKFDRVTYSGMLSVADLEEQFQSCQLVVNPTIEGSGFQIKLLEAISRDIPVISTEYSNMLGDGITATDNPEEMARLISRMMSDTLRVFDYSAYYAKAAAEIEHFVHRRAK